MYKESRVLMDTYCTITVVSHSKKNAQKAIEAGFAEIKKLETILNYFSDTSEIAAINNSAGRNPVKVDAETLEIIKKTIAISEETGGAFDPTLAPVIKLWDFTKKSSDPVLPSMLDIKDALQSAGFRKIKVNEETSEIFLAQKRMEIDLGGIAKGYAADKAVNAIRSKEIKAALVAIAGDIRGYGLSPSGQAWKVGIQNPRPETESEKPWEDVFATLHLKDRAISTSGDYQRFFIKEGRRFHHILNPHTGFPAVSGLISVSVIAPEGYISDGLSTAIFILGAEKGMKILESKGLDGVLVDKDKKVLVTEKLKGNIDILNPDYHL
jgi:thiamine biosynthesis lipoprotein